MAWQQTEKENWFRQQTVQRFYRDQGVAQINALKADFEISQYGALTLNPERYPLYLLKSKNFDPAKKTILISGGVRGYETSGVHGALGFLQREAKTFQDTFNFCGEKAEYQV